MPNIKTYIMLSNAHIPSDKSLSWTYRDQQNWSVKPTMEHLYPWSADFSYFTDGSISVKLYDIVSNHQRDVMVKFSSYNLWNNSLSMSFNTSQDSESYLLNDSSSSESLFEESSENTSSSPESSIENNSFDESSPEHSSENNSFDTSSPEPSSDDDNPMDCHIEISHSGESNYIMLIDSLIEESKDNLSNTIAYAVEDSKDVQMEQEECLRSPSPDRPLVNSRAEELKDTSSNNQRRESFGKGDVISSTGGNFVSFGGLPSMEIITQHRRLKLAPSCFLNGCICGHHVEFRDMAYETRKRRNTRCPGVTIRPKIPPVAIGMRVNH